MKSQKNERFSRTATCGFKEIIQKYTNEEGYIIKEAAPFGAASFIYI